MKPRKTKTALLTINGGSSSIRFAFFEAARPMRRILHGKIDRIGSPGAILDFTGGLTGEVGRRRIARGDRGAAVAFLVGWLRARPEFASVAAVGHRVVHGMQRAEPAFVTEALIRELAACVPFDPDHLPIEIEIIRAFRSVHRGLSQVVCFDTAFHRTMPPVARMLPIPRRYAKAGVVHYGFHGISYSFLMEELARVAGAASKGRVILAHLGGGASLAAVHRGKSVDTTMGFTPAGGLVMGTRSGDLDPGVLSFLSHRESMSAAAFGRMVNRESGLLGISETSSDMRDLVSRERRDPRAADAVRLFCYQTAKWIGAYAAVLGGLDTLVFAGGIGENSPAVRSRVCRGLGFLGIRLDPARNDRGSAVISARTAPVCVRVIHTDEELMIARSVMRVLGIDQTAMKP